ncbi:MAG: STM4013/SEN3800 family hydrolase [Eubacteriales bacterium]|nr:STM4013/SEN3800 family hydrolase [Eubacteriales bacterium]
METDMNDIIGNCDILMVCLDTLRYDVAMREQQTGGTPVLNQYGSWEKCQAVGNFTYPAHQAMFAGFFPCPAEATSHKQRHQLFFPRDIGMGRKTPKGAWAFEGATFVEGLAHVGYHTYCVGGVSFFDKRSPIGSVMPSYFQSSYWHPSFGCLVKESTANQVKQVKRILAKTPEDQRIFLYLNIDAIHYPNYFYLEGETRDSLATHAAALRYVDGQLEALFGAFARRHPTFVICLSDHGTCYGEDGCVSHGINHPAVNTIPYKQFMLGVEKR